MRVDVAVHLEHTSFERFNNGVSGLLKAKTAGTDGSAAFIQSGQRLMTKSFG